MFLRLKTSVKNERNQHLKSPEVDGTPLQIEMYLNLTKKRRQERRNDVTTKTTFEPKGRR